MAVAFSGTSYLKVAQRLLKLADDPAIEPLEREGLLRSAISRAYYAAFISTRDYLREKDKDLDIPVAGTAHSYVINKFRYHQHKHRRNLGWELYYLRFVRNDADYGEVFSNLPKDARASVIQASQILSALNRLK